MIILFSSPETCWFFSTNVRSCRLGWSFYVSLFQVQLIYSCRCESKLTKGKAERTAEG